MNDKDKDMEYNYGSDADDAEAVGLFHRNGVE